MKTLIFFLIIPLIGLAQEPVINNFPSLSIPAHSRGWAMGNTGIAASETNQALSYNVAKMAFVQNFHQASFSYLPWMRSISNDSRLLHADYVASIGDVSAIGFAINYLDMGTVSMRDENGATIGLSKANEFNLATSYALQLGGNASLGTTLRFIGSRYLDGSRYSVCGDLGYYQYADMGAGGKLHWGASVSNLGTRINLPTTASIGIAYEKNDEQDNRWMLTLEATRLIRDDWKGLRISAGAEYGFAQQFFMRAGVNLENQNKGDRKYFSLGIGYKAFVSDQSWSADLHYLVPFGVVSTVSPFQNAFGLTLSLNIGNFQ